MLCLRVPHLYKLELGLPIRVSKQITQAYFETKLRKLIVVLSKERLSPIVTGNDEEEVMETGVESIGAEIAEDKESQGRTEAKLVPLVDTKKLESDLLFDVV